MSRQNILKFTLNKLIAVYVLCCPLILYSQSTTCNAPYIYPVEPEVLDIFQAKGKPQTAAIIRFKLPGFTDPSLKDTFTANHIGLTNRTCTLETVTYEGVKVDCVNFRKTVTTPVTDQQLAYAYLCGYECVYNHNEGVWDGEFKVGATALKNLDLTKPKLVTFFDNSANKISGAATFQVTSDYIDSNSTMLFTAILDQIGTTKTISSTNLHNRNYTFSLSRETIEILSINCQKKITDAGAEMVNVADINSFCEILKTSNPQLFYQALVTDCNTEHLDKAQTDRDKVLRGGRSLEDHFVECKSKCTEFADCAGFAFSIADSTDETKTCFLKVASCGSADDKTVPINSYNNTATEFRFYKKVSI